MRAIGALDEPWDVAFYDPEPGGGIPPAIEFLDSAPRKVRASMLAILAAVADAPPPKFAGGGHWEAMHGQMSGIYEARTKGPDKRLYRMFCLLERSAPGLAHPTLVCLAGMSKPVGTAFSDSEYSRIRRVRDDYESGDPRRVTS